MSYGYYPGCSLKGISVEYDMSIQQLFNVLNITANDLSEWICCGTLAAPSISRTLGFSTPLYTVAKAREEGYDQLVTPCSACLYHFKNAVHHVSRDPSLRCEVEGVIELPLTDIPSIIHPLELLVDEQFESQIKQLLKRDLSDLKVVCYYGCHISRPAEIMDFDDPEHPQSMDRLMELVGVQSLDWTGKVDCCGAHFSMIKPDMVVQMGIKIMKGALEAGADAIVVACPMCHANLDVRQEEINQKMGQESEMPILYFSQVLGYALGVESTLLGMKKHLVDPLPLMLSKCKSIPTSY